MKTGFLVNIRFTNEELTRGLIFLFNSIITFPSSFILSSVYTVCLYLSGEISSWRHMLQRKRLSHPTIHFVLDKYAAAQENRS